LINVNTYKLSSCKNHIKNKLKKNSYSLRKTTVFNYLKIIENNVRSNKFMAKKGEVIYLFRTELCAL